MKILKFYTDSCMPCKVISRVLDRIEGIEVTPVNALDDVDMVEQYDVCSTPTLVFLEEEKEVGRIVGMTNEQAIRDLIGGNGLSNND